MKRAFVFPGQGSQWPGMGQSLAEKHETARRTFDQISQVIGRNVLELCKDARALTTDTRAIQMAVFAVSAAALAVLREEKEIEADVVMGHSLGEVTAFHAAGSLDLETSTRLVEVRGRAMHEAGLKNPGGMFVANGRPMEELDAMGRMSGAELANINSTVSGREQVVFSGSADEIDAVEAGFEPNDRRSFRLTIPIPAHHSQKMIEARTEVLSFVNSIRKRISDAELPVVPNISPSVVTDGAVVAKHLYEQMTHGVNFAGGIEFILRKQKVGEVVEVGSKNVLSGLFSRYVKATEIPVKLHTFGDKVDIDI